MAFHVVYKYNLAAGETTRHPHRLSHVWSNGRVVGHAVCHCVASRAVRRDAVHEAPPSIAPQEARHADNARGRRAMRNRRSGADVSHLNRQAAPRRNRVL